MPAVSPPICFKLPLIVCAIFLPVCAFEIGIGAVLIDIMSMKSPVGSWPPFSPDFAQTARDHSYYSCAVEMFVCAVLVSEINVCLHGDITSIKLAQPPPFASDLARTSDNCLCCLKISVVLFFPCYTSWFMPVHNHGIVLMLAFLM